MPQPRKIIITGTAGFIASHLAEKLLTQDDVVVGIDCLDPFYDLKLKQQNLELLKAFPNYRHVHADIVDEKALDKALLGIDLSNTDAIVHLAAKAGVRPSIENPIQYQDTNVRGTQNMLELARRLGIKQFVFASSSSVYGVNPNVPWSEEDTVLKPISPYASTKVSGELLGHVYSHLYGIRFLGMRFFTVYGPRQRPDLAINKFAQLILKGQPIPVFGNGETRRDYTFVADIVQGLEAAIQYDQSIYELINLGNNQTVTLNELISVLEAALGRKALINRLPNQPGDVPQTWANISKAQSLLRYAPQTEIAAGIKIFADWLKNSA